MRARNELQSALSAAGIVGVYDPAEGPTIPVTVLESIEPPADLVESGADGPNEDMGETARILLDTVSVTRILGAFEYETLASWKLNSEG